MWFLILLLGFIIGIIFTLGIQWYLLYHYFLSLPCQQHVNPTSFIQHNVQLPEEILKLLDVSDSKKKETCLSLNLILQFLFKELRDTVQTKRWFMKKLSVEFEELLQKTTTGKLLEQVMVQELCLGNHFPIIKSISLKNVQMHENGHIEELDVLLDLDYMGGFQLSVTADMVLGRSAFLSVKVTRLQGQARLQFTRIPYTHWSFSFCEEPLMDFQVESHFQGRPLPQVTSLIINQIRRTVRKRHTLPNYKIRYKPFFFKPEPAIDPQSIHLLGNKITEGLIDVTVIQCTRLFKNAATNGSLVYCTLAVDSTAWVELVLSCNTSWVTRDLDINRQPTQVVGITFKQEFVLDRYEHCVVVETIAPNSPASASDIQHGDILVAVNGIKVTSSGQATKLFKQTTEKLTIRIERRSALKFCPSQESLIRDDDSTSGSHGTIADDEADDSTDSGEKVSPGLKSPMSQSPIKKIIQKPSSSQTNFKKGRGHGESQIPIKKNDRKASCVNMPKTVEVDGTNGNVILKRTSAVKFVQDPIWKEMLPFEVEENQQFLNVCVWCQNQEQKQDKSPRLEKDILLGHVSILLLDIAMECASNSQGFHQRTFQLSPPDPKAIASRNHKLSCHPGFDETQCYGDITLAFAYKPQRIPKTTTKITSRQSFAKDSGPDSEDEGFSILTDSMTTEDEKPADDHIFKLTQFHSTVFCKFCGKKIWFKMAFQCQSCSIICHKKCVTKCQAATVCLGNTSQFKPSVHIGQQPEIITTDAVNDVSSDDIDPTHNLVAAETDSASVLESPRTQRRLRSLLTNLTSTSQNRIRSQTDGSSGLTRTGSIHNLAPPSQQSLPFQSKSLPPSPQASPAVSRKTSLQGNLFQTGCESEPEEDIETTVQHLLQYSNDEMLVSTAKERGKEIFSNLSLEERKEKLNAMIAKVQTEIDLETENRNDLAQKERQAQDLNQKTRISFLIAKSDEKIQALAILMLCYCSGLQYTQELEESLKTQAEKVVEANIVTRSDMTED